MFLIRHVDIKPDQHFIMVSDQVNFLSLIRFHLSDLADGFNINIGLY